MMLSYGSHIQLKCKLLIVYPDSSLSYDHVSPIPSVSQSRELELPQSLWVLEIPHSLYHFCNPLLHFLELIYIRFPVKCPDRVIVSASVALPMALYKYVYDYDYDCIPNVISLDAYISKQMPQGLCLGNFFFLSATADYKLY